MIIKEELVKDFSTKIYDICHVVANDAHIYIANHDVEKISSYYKYPVHSLEHFYENKAFGEDVKEKVAFFKYGIPKYHMADFPEKMINYDAIFNGYQTDRIDISLYSEYQELKDWVEKNESILNALTRNKDINFEYYLKSLIGESIERYLFTTKATGDIPDDIDKKLKNIIDQALVYYMDDKLYFDVCVPICMAIFEQDTIRLSDKIEIVRITEDFQKARQKACSYEVVEEDWIAACATHMIVFHDYYYDNTNEFLISTVIKDYNSYPLKEIDKIFGIIRLVTGYEIGYEQVLCRPRGWMYNSCADLPIVYGAKSHFVNPKEIKKFWMNITVSVVTKEQCIEIEKLYKAFIKCEDKISFPLLRYNRCMLRDEIDDMATDACIGLESLLAGGTKGEITYTISNRIPIVFSKFKTEKYSAVNCRVIMKKIYNFRSKIVHGGELKKKDKYIINDDENWYIPNVAVDFLRYTLIFMIKNNQFLETAKIDEYIDSVIYDSFEDM